MIFIQLEAAIQKMASLAVKDVKNGYVIGLGSGSTMAEFVRKLVSYIRENHLQIKLIPSSLQIQMVVEELGLQVEELSLISKITLTIDGADQVDRDFNLIKGGGGALFKERILMAAAQRTIILVDETKFSEHLDKPVPVEVSPFVRSFVADKLKMLGGWPHLRVNSKGYPYMTENGNLIFDTDFGIIHNPAQLEGKIRSIPGVIEVGIFTTNVNIIYKACKDGSVAKISVK